ncbi:MAG: hypothetical protein ACO1N9_14450 [Flavobacterium sp.]
MSKKLILAILTLISIVSCKDEKQPVEPSNDKSNTSADCSVILEAKFSLNDKFQVYYTEDQSDELSGENVVDMYVYGSPDMQTITIPFPDGIIPYKIRFDLGENNSQSIMVIKNISIKYKDKVIDGDNGKFMNFWTPNEAIKYDASNFVYNLTQVNGLHDPLLVSNANLEDELLSLHPSKK